MIGCIISAAHCQNWVNRNSRVLCKNKSNTMSSNMSLTDMDPYWPSRTERLGVQWFLLALFLHLVFTTMNCISSRHSKPQQNSFSMNVQRMETPSVQKHADVYSLYSIKKWAKISFTLKAGFNCWSIMGAGKRILYSTCCCWNSEGTGHVLEDEKLINNNILTFLIILHTVSINTACYIFNPLVHELWRPESRFLCVFTLLWGRKKNTYSPLFQKSDFFRRLLTCPLLWTSCTYALNIKQHKPNVRMK